MDSLLLRRRAMMGAGTPLLDPVVAFFNYRQTAGGASIGKGKAKIQEVRGESLVWNQLVQNGDFADGGNNWNFAGSGLVPMGGTITYQSDGVLIEGQTTSSSAVVYQRIYPSAEGQSRKYLAVAVVESSFSTQFRFGYISDSWSETVTAVSANTKTQLSFIIQPSVNFKSLALSCLSQIAAGEWIKIQHINFIDLTLMFGAGNEPSTVAEFEALYPLPYYAYNAGTLINNSATGLESVGFNQLKIQGRSEYSNSAASYPSFAKVFKESEYWIGFAYNGYYNKSIGPTNIVLGEGSVSGHGRNDGNSYGIGFPIKCKPGEIYYIKSTTGAVGFFDSDGKFLNKQFTNSNGTFTIPDNCAWMVVVVGRVRNADFTETDICINISNASLNGTYKPYWGTDTLSLPITTATGKLNGQGSSVTIFPDGMKKVGSTYDVLTATSATKRIGSRAYQSGDESDTSVITDGTTTYYALATPEEYILDTPLDLRYLVEAGGTEAKLPADTASAVTAPLSLFTRYPKP